MPNATPLCSTVPARWRKPVRTLVISLAFGVLVLWAFDFLRPANSPPLWMIYGKALTKGFWAIPALGVLSLVLLLLGEGLSRRGVGTSSTRRLKQAGLIVGSLMAIPLGLIMLADCVYEPIKFTYLIWKVEGAKTVEDERAAFKSAARWGCIWELNRVRSHEDLPSRVRRLEGDWILELEWLECWPSGKPYRAYRKVIDEHNLRFLLGRPLVKTRGDPDHHAVSPFRYQGSRGRHWPRESLFSSRRVVRLGLMRLGRLALA